MPFRAALGTGKTKRNLSTLASPVFFTAAPPGNLRIFLTALSPVREAYQAVKYRCVAGVQRRAEMIPGELHIHRVCPPTLLLDFQRINALIELKSEWELPILPEQVRKREETHRSAKEVLWYLLHEASHPQSRAVRATPTLASYGSKEATCFRRSRSTKNNRIEKRSVKLTYTTI
jgi:hypothetical protein